MSEEQQLKDALALVDFGACRDGDPADWINVASPMCDHCIGLEDVNLAAARIITDAYRKRVNWQERYDHLVESLPKNKRPFSDKQAQKVIASQVKRITQLEDDLSFARCELDKLRKKNPASGC